MAIILIASTDLGTGSNSYLILKPFLTWFYPAITEPEIYRWNIFFRKTMHVAQFAVLSGLVWKTRRPIWHRPGPGDLRLAGFTLAIAAVFSVASEGIQLLFPESRGASVSDVFLDMGGAILGLVIIWFMKRGGTGQPPPGLRQGSGGGFPVPSGVRVLITADLHLDLAEGDVTVLDHLRSAIIEEAPDVCVIAGDIGTAERADHWLTLIREATGGVPLVACLGNHDHWMAPERWDEFPSPASVRDRLWRPALARAKIHALDYGNFTTGGLVITGGYGHFDLGMRERKLEIRGEPATLDHYRAGRYAGAVWNDMQRIPNAAETLESEARIQAEGIGRRLDDAVASGRTVLLITHTVPFAELNGHAADATMRPSQFFNAYAGNTLVGDRVAAHPDRIALAVCGHTRKEVPRTSIRGIPCANVGSDYGNLRFVLFDSATRPA